MDKLSMLMKIRQQIKELDAYVNSQKKSGKSVKLTARKGK